MGCSICSHPHRTDIESALLYRNISNQEVSIDSIASEFGVPARDLQVHALMHTTAVSEDAGATLTGLIKYKEAEVLQSTLNEYYTTLKNLGVKINRMISAHGDENLTMNKIPKQMVDLYLGLGSEIRSGTDSLVRMNTSINGEKDSGVKALGELVLAIRQSPTEEVEDGGDTV